MLLLTLQFSLLEIVILQIGALILGCTIYFFIASRRSLQQALRNGYNTPLRTGRTSLLERFSMKGEVMSDRVPGMRPSEITWPDPLVAAGRKQGAQEPVVLPTVSAASQNAYPTITALMQRVEQLEALTGTRQMGVDLHQKVEELEAALAEKAAALKQARQQEEIAAQMTNRMEEVFREFEQLQDKMAALEEQAAAAQEQAIELEELQHAYHLLQKDLVRKQDKLNDLVEENGRLQLELSAAADKLVLVDQQRQQLSQRSRLVQEMQMDMEAISEGQSKLKQQLHRISELETMLEQIGGKHR